MSVAFGSKVVKKISSYLDRINRIYRIEEDDDLTQRPQDPRMGENAPSRRRHLTIGRIVVANTLGQSEWNGQQDDDLSSGCL